MDDSRDLNLEKQIDAYIKGHLTKEKEVESLWIELLKRPDYIDRLETELSVKLILEEELKEKREEHSETQVTSISKGPLAKSWKWLAVAASVVILAISINFLQSDSEKTLRELTLGKINIVENLASPQVVRSQKNEISSVDSLLNLGFKAAISGDLEQAMKIYNDVIRNFNETPRVAMAYLNVGIIEYNGEQYGKASLSFEDAIKRVVDDPILEEKAYWYLGNAYVNLDRLEQARKAINSAYLLDGIYKQSALRLLEKIDSELGDTDSGNFDELIED